MNIEIKKLDKSDYKKVIQYAIKGMHFDMYMDNKLELSLYGRYFWYLELTNATQVIAAYLDDELAGVLLADIKGEDKLYRYFWKNCMLRCLNGYKELFLKIAWEYMIK